MKITIAVAVLCVLFGCEGRNLGDTRLKRQVDLDTILDVFGSPNDNQPGNNQFGQGGNQFGQNQGQLGSGQGGNQFGQNGNQFGQNQGQFRPGQGQGQFGQGQGQLGGGQGQLGSGQEQFGGQFGQGGNQFGQQGTNQQGGNINNNPTTTTQSPRVRQCITNCQTTPQYNPVCGSNGIQYLNIERLNCARRCGVDVRPLARGSNC